MAKTWRLDFNDLSWRIISAPPILSGPPDRPVLVSRLLRAVHSEFTQAIDRHNLPVWPVTQQIEGVFYAHPSLTPYYQELARLIIPDIKLGDIAWESRHRFFVATETVPCRYADQQLRGLSGIEQLLGLTYPETAPTGQEDQGAGDMDLTALSFYNLTFPESDALAMARTFGTADISDMAAYANRLKEEARERAESERQGKKKATAPEAPEPVTNADDDLFLGAKARILARLGQMGVVVPEGF